MAKNMRRSSGDELPVVCTAPTTPVSGDPVVYGQRPGVALTDESAADTAISGNPTGFTSVKFSGVFDLSVKGIDGVGNSAVAAGDILYYTAGDTPPLSKKATGVRFGYAGDGQTGNLVASGATTTIPVTIGY